VRASDPRSTINLVDGSKVKPSSHIGGINAAIIAGNPPNMRLDRLRDFWTQVTFDAPWDWFGWKGAKGDRARKLLNRFSANLALSQGAKGFFAAKPISPWLQPPGTLEATSFYDTHELKRTLERLVDFDRLNAGLLRFSVGAVNVRTGKFRLLRHDDAHDQTGARDGKRRASPRFSSH
jgi:NTE family protein